jgi:hypothetical protein
VVDPRSCQMFVTLGELSNISFFSFPHVSKVGVGIAGYFATDQLG